MEVGAEKWLNGNSFTGNPGAAKGENALAQNHLQLHKKPEKVSHPGQVEVGSSISTAISD